MRTIPIDSTRDEILKNVFKNVFLDGVKKDPEVYDPNQEWQNIELEFKQIIQQASYLADVNLRIQFLTYQIDSLVKKIDQGYTQLAKEKVALVNEASEQIQTNLSRNITYIVVFALFTIGLIIILGFYIYRL